MKPKRKTITPEMLRACFGPDAAITKRLGWFRVTTRDGGEVKIRDRDIKPVHLSRLALAGCARVAGEAWGGGQVHGSPDFLMAMLAHGEAEGGVKLRVAERGQCTRMIVSFLVSWIGISFSDPGAGPFVWLFLGGVVWLVMKWAAKRQAQRETEQMGFPFPLTGGEAREAGDEDLRDGGWL